MKINNNSIFDNKITTCPDCKKKFIGIAINVDDSSPTGLYPAPANIIMDKYPLS